MVDSYNRNANRSDNSSRHSSPRPEQSRRTQPDDNYRPSDYHSNSDHHHSDPDPATLYSPIIQSESNSSFAAITADLRARIIDWKGHPLSDLGPLQMYDLLSVRRDNLVREFYVYLFREALICVVEERKRSLGRLLSNASNGFSDGASSINGVNGNKGVLRLKGRIYVRHIKHVTATSAAGEMSLTIDMEDELASFILIYKDRGTMDAWKRTIEALVGLFNNSPPNPTGYSNQDQNGRGLDVEEFGGSSKAMRMLSGGTAASGSTVSSYDSLLHDSSRSTRSSSTSHGSYQHPSQRANNMTHKLSGIGEDDELSSYESQSSPGPLVTPYTSSGPSNNLAPLPHPPTDLILVISVPPPSASPSTAQLKIRVIKTTLDFLIASMGPKDRISLVTFEVGIGGKIRKTPFLTTARTNSRHRLESFIEGIVFGREVDENGEYEVKDEFLVRGNKEEKTDVVTAVNHGLSALILTRLCLTAWLIRS